MCHIFSLQPYHSLATRLSHNVKTKLILSEIVGLVNSNDANNKKIITQMLMSISPTIVYSAVVAVMRLSLLRCCGLGRNDSIGGNTSMQ